MKTKQTTMNDLINRTHRYDSFGDYISASRHRKRYARIICGDGVSVSIQAGYDTYSLPAGDGLFTHVEAGYPSVEPPASWRDYAEDDTNLCNTVYIMLPWKCVDEFFAAHGGMVLGELPPRA